MEANVSTVPASSDGYAVQFKTLSVHYLLNKHGNENGKLSLFHITLTSKKHIVCAFTSWHGS